MWFKTLHLYRVHDAVALALPVLNEALQEQAFRPLGSAEAKRMGWVAPAGRGSEAF
ncbi:recombination-associated protein RdgC, partial [Halomonas sp. BBD45]